MDGANVNGHRTRGQGWAGVERLRSMDGGPGDQGGKRGGGPIGAEGQEGRHHAGCHSIAAPWDSGKQDCGDSW